MDLLLSNRGRRALLGARLLDLRAQTVCEGDEFEIQADFVHHVPVEPRSGKVKSVYAIASLSDGHQVTVTLTREQLEMLPIQSEASRPLWRKHFGEMSLNAVTAMAMDKALEHFGPGGQA